MSESEKYSIEMANISKTYLSGEIRVEALKNLDLKIEKGERVVILGPSGSGKTTLLNLLGGITSPDEDGDHLIIFRKNIKDYTQKQFSNYRRDKVGFIFQFFNLFPSLNALDNVIIGINVLNKKRKEKLDQYKIAKEYLKKVGLGNRLYHYPSQLSGGEQQRVAIARALAKISFVGKEFILLCDEPTGNLDTETGDRILNLMIDLNKEIGITIILVTHNLNIAKMFATRIIHIKNGSLDL
jgi:putative ABC transport system ATP-binding protein